MHELALTAYLTNSLSSPEQWRTLFMAIDLLDKAQIVEFGDTFTFRQSYTKYVDIPLADSYIHELLALKNIERDSPSLWARYARRINQLWRERFAEFSSARLLLVYWLYWWHSFARGYAFELEIFRDLDKSGVMFRAHDLTKRQERFSFGDLKVGDLLGDIKTSLYFVQLKNVTNHDFYIVRLFLGKHSYTVVVLLRMAVWPLFNGDTIVGDWDTLRKNLSLPVKIETKTVNFVALSFGEWKRRVKRWQGEDGNGYDNSNE